MGPKEPNPNLITWHVSILELELTNQTAKTKSPPFPFKKTISDHQSIIPGRQKPLYPKTQTQLKKTKIKHEQTNKKNNKHIVTGILLYRIATGLVLVDFVSSKNGATEHSERSPKCTVPSPRRYGAYASRSVAARFSAHTRCVAGTALDFFLLCFALLLRFEGFGFDSCEEFVCVLIDFVVRFVR